MDLESINISRLLIEFKPLIHKTIHRLNIHPRHINYDDYFQELQMKLIQIYQSFDGDPLYNKEDRYKFTAYAGNGLYWRGIDLFKDKQFTSLPTMEDMQLEQLIEDSGSISEGSVYIEDFLTKAQVRLTESEYLLFLYLAEGKYTITEIAELMNVSRGTVYKRRAKIQKKLEDIKECLKP
ncbi:MAG TPA: sigma-70 family RNA polymerase sigma factor [Atopostipes sp.]|nr:sigma-70 family RNA polymerase sigma factor [Atopostipes sp.]